MEMQHRKFSAGVKERRGYTAQHSMMRKEQDDQKLHWWGCPEVENYKHILNHM
jgi:hypothetical protein